MLIDIANAKEQLVLINEKIGSPHLLIGGLAVEQYYKGRDSKDIDLVCSFKVAKILLKLFSSCDWHITDKNSDEYRPSYEIQNNLYPELVIIFGPKISEREQYNYIEWEEFRADAKPFEYRGRFLHNILIPTAESLAFTKLISAVERKEKSREKSRQDFEDFVNLTNHRTFNVNNFTYLLKRAKLTFDFVQNISKTILEYSDEWNLSNIKYLLDVLVYGNLRDDISRQRLVEISQSGHALLVDGNFPITNIFPNTSQESQEDLLGRLVNAKREFIAFGLTRNFYADKISETLLDCSNRIKIKIFLMDPFCASREDRYRIEPIEAAFEDPKRFQRMILDKYKRLLGNSNRKTKKRRGSLDVYLFNFPVSFAIERIDDFIRVMLYGHGVRGTDGPIFVFKSNNPYFEYFSKQLDWLQQMGDNNLYDEAKGHNLGVTKLSFSSENDGNKHDS